MKSKKEKFDKTRIFKAVRAMDYKALIGAFVECEDLDKDFLIKSEPDNLKEIKLDVLYQLKAYHEAATVTESNLDKAIFHREACNELIAIVKRAK